MWGMWVSKREESRMRAQILVKHKVGDRSRHRQMPKFQGNTGIVYWMSEDVSGSVSGIKEQQLVILSVHSMWITEATAVLSTERTEYER